VRVRAKKTHGKLTNNAKLEDGAWGD